MADITIEADAFGRTLSELMGRLGSSIVQCTPKTVDAAMKVAETEWKKNARAAFKGTYYIGGWGKPGRGRPVRAGKYAASISHKIIHSGGDLVEGEAGSRTMPGLAHLLEKGHARIGGGSVAGRKHIEPAADKAFSDFEKLIDEAVEEALNDL